VPVTYNKHHVENALATESFHSESDAAQLAARNSKKQMQWLTGLLSRLAPTERNARQQGLAFRRGTTPVARNENTSSPRW
jgi:hypothetical protein